MNLIEWRVFTLGMGLGDLTCIPPISTILGTRGRGPSKEKWPLTNTMEVL